MHRKTFAVLVIAVTLAVATSGYALREINAPATGPVCPAIFANVTFENETGFVAVTHPSSTSTEFVLAPGSTARLATVFSSESNNLSKTMFDGAVPVWFVSLNNNSYTPTSDVRVTVDAVTNQTNHEVIVNYSIASATGNGLFLIGIPSTCHGAWVNVGTTPYAGSVP
jgi:hypothetical protein